MNLNNMKSKEIIEIIKKEDLLEFFFELDGEYFEKYDKYLDDDEELQINTEEKEVEYLTGLGLNNYEDKGGRADTSEFWNVVYFPDHDVYIEITGHYSSYNGTDFYDGYGHEVKPTQKTITVYE